MTQDIRTLGDYVEKARNDSRLKRTTHSYIADMFQHYSPLEIFPNLRANKRQVGLVSQYFLGSANFGSLAERLLLLLGPQGVGKTTLCNDLKQSLVTYCKTDQGLAYAVAGCPFHQHPFDVLGAEDRGKHGLVWHQEAGPCPVCEKSLEQYGGWEQMPVTRFYYGPRSGIADHTAVDQRREDITEFLGDVDYSMVLKAKGSKSNPEAYDWAGKFVWANRGILDWDEILKSRRQLMTSLLMLTQSKAIAYPKFPKLHADIAIIGATNYGEYDLALKDNVLEPLFGRAFVVGFRYILDAKEEAEITKLRARQMQQYSKFKDDKSVLCINEAVLREYLAKLIVNSRMPEGESGLSPRVTLDIFSNAYMNATRKNAPCISFDQYRDSYEFVLSSELHKNKDLADKFSIDSKLAQQVTKEFFDQLWKTVAEKICATSDEFKRMGQNKYIEYLSVLERQSRGEELSQRDKELSAAVAHYLNTESQKQIQDQEAFERIFIVRLDEYKKQHYTQIERLRGPINNIVSSNIRTILKNYSYNEELHDKDRVLVNELTSAFGQAISGCRHCADGLLRFIGENL
ncbi:hypothetical protein HY639_05300 [Candidatus Woesearchaeota archaeon]|nr:hypothetical protein [Candidatus Woesearchaeota archaeon]